MLYPVVETFASIQGEGLRTGQWTKFVRLAHCNLKCSFCDTNYEIVRATLHEDEILAELEGLPGLNDVICITGGEPTLYDLGPLYFEAIEKSCEVQIETNGTMSKWGFGYASRQIHWTVSPKTEEIPDWLYSRAAEFKFVVFGRSYALLRHHIRKIPLTTPIYLQPDSNKPEEIASILNFLQSPLTDHSYRLGLQIHKVIGVR